MGKIINSSRDNIFGDGKEQIFTDDNNNEYVIRNSSRDNIFGDGKEQIVEKIEGQNNSGISIFSPIIGILVFISFITMVLVDGAFYPCLIFIGLCTLISLSKFLSLRFAITIIGMFIGLIFAAVLTFEGMNWLFTHNLPDYRPLINWFGLFY